MDCRKCRSEGNGRERKQSTVPANWGLKGREETSKAEGRSKLGETDTFVERVPM